MPRISHESSNARSSTSVLSQAIPVRRDRFVRSKSVPCPDCGAEVGASCVSAAGTPTQRHASRRRMALRAEAAEYSVDDVRFAVHMTFAQRRLILRNAGVTRSELADLLAINRTVMWTWLTTDHPAGPEGARFGAWLREHQDDRRAEMPAVLPEVVVQPQGKRCDPWSEPPPKRPDREPSRLDVGTLCDDCGKWLPGERHVCGRCYVKRNAARR